MQTLIFRIESFVFTQMFSCALLIIIIKIISEYRPFFCNFTIAPFGVKCWYVIVYFANIIVWQVVFPLLPLFSVQRQPKRDRLWPDFSLCYTRTLFEFLWVKRKNLILFLVLVNPWYILNFFRKWLHLKGRMLPNKLHETASTNVDGFLVQDVVCIFFMKNKIKTKIDTMGNFDAQQREPSRPIKTLDLFG